MKKLLILGLFLFVGGLVGNAILYATGNDAILNTKDYKKTETFSSSEFDNIFINSKEHGADINIVTTDSNEVKVVMEGKIPVGVKEKSSLESRVFNNTLFIEPISFFNSKRNQIKFNINGDLKMNIYIPNKVFDDFSIQSQVGRINVQDINVNMLKIDSETGRITVNRVTAQDSVITSHVGKIELYELSGNVNSSTNTGAIELRTKELSKVTRLKTDVGEIEVHLLKLPSDLKIDANTDIGSIDISIPGLDEKSENRSLTKTIGNGSNQLILETSTGSISVQ
ncbi:MAG: hypothetical protein K0S51_1911 [Bacillales bacterium]|jgi:DUF4097 and DUF4098 domain-containing protein YvlB|nr:hypothetical protein [Bacillales bacterium]